MAGSNALNRYISSRVVPITRGRGSAAASARMSPGSRSPYDVGAKAVRARVGSASTAACAANRSSTGHVRRSSIDCAPAAATSSPVAWSARRRGSQLRQRGAHRDGAVEQVAGARRGEEGDDARTAGGLAEDRHVVGVTAERPDRVADPRERGNLIGDAMVRTTGEAERTEAVVDGDDDDVAERGERCAVVPRRRAAARSGTRRRGSRPARVAGRCHTPA